MTADRTPKLSRRTVLGSAAAAAAASPISALAAGDRPNILWVVSEDNNPFIGAYGDRLAHTPTLDGLAARGVLYQKVYSTAPVCAPSRFSLITGAPAESNAPANHMRAVAKLPAGWRTTPEVLREAGYYCTNNEKTDYNCDIDPAKIWDESSAKAHWRNRPAGRPFFSVFNYMTTHESQLFQITPGRVTPDQVTPTPDLPDTPEVRQDIASYYNLMERMDGQIAQRLAELEQAGLHDDTIVFYYSDNGGVLPKSKRYCSDKGLRVAMIAYYPPKWAHLAPAPPGSVVREPVTLMDLPPTVLRLAGCAPPRQMRGRALIRKAPRQGKPYAFGMRNRMDERYDVVRSVTDGRWRYTRNYLPHIPSAQHGAFEWQAKGYQSLETEYRAHRLNAAQARFFEPRPFEELYDLETDPFELHNLASAATARAKLTELRRALDAHMLEINDNGFIPEGSPLEGYDRSRVPGAYPLPTIMALAAAAGARNPADLPRRIAGLNDANEVIRYWNAQGLAMLGPQAALAVEPLTRRFEVEPSPQVRVALAEAIGYAGALPAASPRLVQLASSDPSPRVRLQALNALTHIGATGPDVLAVARASAASSDEYLKSAGRYLELVLTGAYRPDVKIFDMQAMMRKSATSPK